MAPPVWRSTTPLAHQLALGLIGSGPVSILAGFSLSAVISVASADPRNGWHDLAVCLFAASVVALLFTLRFLISAQYHQASPSDRLSWHPEATLVADELEAERHEQRRDFQLYIFFRNRAVRWFPVGVATALFGLAAAVAAELASSSPWLAGGLAGMLFVAGIVALSEISPKTEGIFPIGQLFPTTDQAVEMVRRKQARRKRKDRKLQHAADPFSAPPRLDPIGLASVLGKKQGEELLEAPEHRSAADLARAASTMRVGGLYRRVAASLLQTFGGRYYTTSASLVVTGVVNGAERAIVALHPLSSGPDRGLLFSISTTAVANGLGVPEADVIAALPPGTQGTSWSFRDLPYHGYVRTPSEFDELVELVRRAG